MAEQQAVKCQKLVQRIQRGPREPCGKPAVEGHDLCALHLRVREQRRERLRNG